MLNFTYSNHTDIIFGKGTQHTVGQHIKPHAGKILLHYGGGSIKRSGLYEEIIRSLQEAGIEIHELGGVQPNPTLDLVREGITLCRRHAIPFILAVGGGSVIDSAKAIALGAPSSGDVWEYYISKQPADFTPLRVATVLTIPAAGSESSPNSVITCTATKRKLGYGDPQLRPVFSIVNPELFYTLPENQLAYGACDMMSHIFERYFTNTPHTDLTDALCEATLRTIINNARLLRHGGLRQYDPWAELAFSGTIAHNNLLGLGREQDWACHAMEHELSARYDVPHGAGLAVITPAWMRYIYKNHIPIFLQFAERVMGVTIPPREPETAILEAIRRLEAYYEEMGLPTTMRQLGIPADHFADMAAQAVSVRGPIGGLQKLDANDVLAIYNLADK